MHTSKRCMYTPIYRKCILGKRLARSLIIYIYINHMYQIETSQYSYKYRPIFIFNYICVRIYINVCTHINEILFRVYKDIYMCVCVNYIQYLNFMYVRI